MIKNLIAEEDDESSSNSSAKEMKRMNRRVIGSDKPAGPFDSMEINVNLVENSSVATLKDRKWKQQSVTEYVKGGMRVIEKRDFQLVRYKQKDNDRVNSHHLRSEDSLENTPIDTEESGCKNSFCMDD